MTRRTPKPPSRGKGDATKSRIVEAALKMFLKHGFEKTTMRGLSEKVGCSLGLTYRYFPSKEAIVLEFYRNLAADFPASLTRIAQGKLASRFANLLELRFSELGEFRTLFAALSGAMLTVDSSVSLLGPQSAAVRRATVQVFEDLVTTSEHSVPKEHRHSLAVVLFALHLVIFFIWVNDQSKQLTNTKKVIQGAEDALRLAVPLLLFPGAYGKLERLSDLCSEILHLGPAAKRKTS